jgi:transcriptional repressor NrdR
MNCPVCNSDTKVIDSRGVRRRRECLKCAQRFSTIETAESFGPTVIKRNGEREPFDGNKIRNGMLRALEKRPVDMDKIESLIISIMKETEIHTSQIGELVMKQLDAVAYIRFVSVFKRFETVEDYHEYI